MGFYLKRFYRKYVLNDLKDDIVISVPTNLIGGQIWTGDYLKASRAKRFGYLAMAIFILLVLTLFSLGLYHHIGGRFLKDANQYGYNWWATLIIIVSVILLFWGWIESFNGIRWMLRKFRT